MRKLSLSTFSAAAIGALLLGAVGLTAAESESAAGILAQAQAFFPDYARPDSIPFPADNPYTDEKAELGRTLFFDPRLSSSGWISCASCHNPALGWEDGLPLGIGHGFGQLGRHTPTISNLAWGVFNFWDGRAESMEAQAVGPIQAAGEMNMPHGEVVERLAGIAGYGPMFEAAFGDPEVTIDRIGQAIATFERTIVSNLAPFDHWVAGDEDAISESAQRGFVVFNTTGQCSTCHTTWRFTDDGFHDIGLPDDDLGRALIVPDVPVLEHAFKTPGLRNLTERAPFMHDGSLPDLAAVIDHYASGFVQRESLSWAITPLELSDQDRQDLIAFLESLTSVDDPIAVPVVPQ
jgi:cytochrome c peroxidase